MANETGDTNDAKLRENLQRPAEMEQDGRRARQHPVRELDEAVGKQVSTQRLQTGFGIKTSRIQPGGSA